jgi:hypothetical protein
MTKFWFFLLAFSGFGLLNGCQESSTTAVKPVITESKKTKFPAVMVGVWEAQVDWVENKWGIRFEKDGSIHKIIHAVAGPMKVEEGGISGEGPDKGTFMYFILGPCFSEYDPHSKMLKVTIVIDDYMMKLPTGELKGRMRDYLEGPISSDGKTWKVKWWSYGQLEGATNPSEEEINALPGDELVFTKTDLKKPEPQKESKLQ